MRQSWEEGKQWALEKGGCENMVEGGLLLDVHGGCSMGHFLNDTFIRSQTSLWLLAYFPSNGGTLGLLQHQNDPMDWDWDQGLVTGDTTSAYGAALENFRSATW